MGRTPTAPFYVEVERFTDDSETYHVKHGYEIVASSNHEPNAERLVETLNLAIETFVVGDPRHVNTVG